MCHANGPIIAFPLLCLPLFASVRVPSLFICIVCSLYFFPVTLCVLLAAWQLRFEIGFTS